MYVDDFSWAGTKAFKENVVNKISDMFSIGGAECKSFKYIGLNIETFEDDVCVDQCQYASSVKKKDISKKSSIEKRSELSERERAVIGQLNWISTHSRPDISFDVYELSTQIKRATIEDLLRLNKVIERVTQDCLRVLFPQIESSEKCQMECYSDASFGNLTDSGSQGAFVIFLRDETGKRCHLLWQTKKIRCGVKLTLSAKTLALLDCAEAAVYIFILCEVFGCRALKINCLVGNKSLVDALQSFNSIEDKRLRIDMAVLRCMLDNVEISKVSWIASPQQLADCLTKKGASTVQLGAAFSV